MAAKIGESVGLKGAKAIGDKRVSSLMQFSWSARHDSSVHRVNASHASKGERNGGNGQSSVQKAGRDSKG
jgi:hypothetical protein